MRRMFLPSLAVLSLLSLSSPVLADAPPADDLALGAHFSQVLDAHPARPAAMTPTTRATPAGAGPGRGSRAPGRGGGGGCGEAAGAVAHLAFTLVLGALLTAAGASGLFSWGKKLSSAAKVTAQRAVAASIR